MANKIEDLKLTLEVGTGRRNIGRDGMGRPFDNPADLIPMTFQVCRKPLRLGALEFDQYWMDCRRLFPGRGRSDTNFSTIVKYFWEKAMEDRSILLMDEPQDTFILANLLPYIRSTNAHEIVDSAVVTSLPKKRYAAVSVLEDRLREAKNEELSPVEFNRMAKEIIGRVSYTDNARERYAQMASELLEKARLAIEKEGESGVRVAIDHWKHWYETIGKHGKPDAKEVLDILSYESRAAFCQCYSLVWLDLINHLVQENDLSTEWARFHVLWHLDQRRPEPGRPDADFHLLMGLPWGLHPAAGTFIQTLTGESLLGEWVASPSVQAHLYLWRTWPIDRTSPHPAPWVQLGFSTLLSILPDYMNFCSLFRCALAQRTRTANHAGVTGGVGAYSAG